ncbi:MAG: DNA-processing protein DprA [Synergistaceae bacterium]|nr:DNA-processing protein DprA [Synergistaceae bacterium]
MDEVTKAFLLLGSVTADIRAWRKMAARSFEPRSLWEGDFTQIGRELRLSENSFDLLKRRAKAGWAEREAERCAALGVKLITCEDASYPSSLFDLDNAPLVLYWKGVDIDIQSYRTVGVVGTRKCSSYGKINAEKIGNCCANYNGLLISGGAMGIDGSAHHGASEANGKTIAVFGNGVDVVFPQCNAKLFDRIAENGALISEFPLGACGEAWRFPRRNRLVAALSERLVVVEAPMKSGAMITARLALELGREVWAVPGRINDEVSDGPNRLIFDGAYPYISDDVFWGPQVTDDISDGSAERPVLSPVEQLVMDRLVRSGGHTVDNIADEVNMGAAEVLKIITLLSAKGLVYSSGPGRYSSKN